ncbi:hypothetical protein ACH62S_20770, partial [Klebsiella pneumoniae]
SFNSAKVRFIQQNRKTEMAISSAFSLEAARSSSFPYQARASRSMSFVSMVEGNSSSSGGVLL